MSRQGGMSTLIMTAVLLAVMGLIALGLAQSGWLNEKAAGNQAAAARNAETLDTALEVAQQKLNTFEKRADYVDLGTGMSRAVNYNGDGGVATVMTPVTGLTGTTDVTVGLCTSGSADACSARYSVSQTYMLKANLRYPANGLEAGAAVVALGNLSAAGGAAASGTLRIGGQVTSLSGSQIDSKSVVQQAPELQAASAFFALFFDGTPDEIRDAAYREGTIPEATGGLYWQDGDLSLSGSTYGSATAPVIIVVNQGSLSFAGQPTVYGFIYVLPRAGGTVDLSGAKIIGGLAAAGPLNLTGGINVARDDAVLNQLKYSAGTFAKLPDSWRDF